jgi:N-ethylmaleimide reductase
VWHCVSKLISYKFIIILNNNRIFAKKIYMKLFEPALKNHIVMAPMTRCRAIGNIPNDLIALYYEQRAGAGLIVTEGTPPSPNGLGYARIPGIFNDKQVAGWKKITKAVHNNGGKIFIQFMHTGRMSHVLNLPEEARILAPSAISVSTGQMWTDQKGLQDFSMPEAMTTEDIIQTKNEFVSAAKKAMDAGFDGVELHGANGYLLEQFLSPVSNQRTDEYGGSIENRCRFVVEVAEAVSMAIGKEKTAIRLSPYGAAGDMKPYAEVDATYTYLAEKLNDLGIVYIHLVDHSAMGAPEVPMTIKLAIREKFKNCLILAGGYNKETAEKDLQSGLADLIAFGKPFISNPDLVHRLENDLPLAEVDFSALYSADEKGFTDYPVCMN